MEPTFEAINAPSAQVSPRRGRKGDGRERERKGERREREREIERERRGGNGLGS